MSTPSTELPSRPAETTSDPGLADDARGLHRSLSELTRILQLRDRDCICCHDISVSQCYALEALCRRGPLRMNDLAAELYLDKSTTSRVAESLVTKGYLVKGPHPEDGRALLLEATDSGRALFARIDEDLMLQVRTLIAEFDPAVRQAMTQLLARLVQAAAARVENAGGCCRMRECC